MFIVRREWDDFLMNQAIDFSQAIYLHVIKAKQNNS